ncbi:MAG: lipoate--protein ligase family protein [Candidatus Freyarchaeota archaeon]|nr:lipoate--protein ligase family protein [Candidatus Jordarchaeia archaeon]MBS7269967.1 lipoate--protein ligase family protein [Candidatus Jordarchaeia archaeon]MBS7280663.1 lipoate--protein ligase family protein [Candidatus Jordarchaeia archaeon]
MCPDKFWKREDEKEGWKDDEMADLHWYIDTPEYVVRGAVMASIPQGILPPSVFVFATWTNSGVNFSYFVSPEKDLDLEYAKRNGVSVGVRGTVTGGCSWTDKGNPGNAVGFSRNHPKCPSSLGDLYRIVFTAYADAISDEYGVKTRFRPINDIEVLCDDGVWRKFGLAGGLESSSFLAVGNSVQLTEVPWDIVDKVIIPPPEKFADKETKTLRDRSTFFNKVVGREVSFEELEMVLKKGVEKAFNVTFIPTKIFWEDIPFYNSIKKLLTSEDWFYARTERKKFQNTPITSDVKRGEALDKIPQGPLVRVTVLVKNEKIYNILITGSIHAAPIIPESPIDAMERELQGTAAEKNAVREKVEKIFNTESYQIMNITPEQFTKIIMKAIKAATS